MLKIKYIEKISRNTNQVLAIAEKNLTLNFRFKAYMIRFYITPFLQVLINFLLFGTFFAINPKFDIGYWNVSNFILFSIIGITIQYNNLIINGFEMHFRNEKYWNTLQGILVAPVNRFTLLIGNLFSMLIIMSVPVIFFDILAIIFFPISPIYLLLYLLIFLSIVLIYGSLGLIIGVFFISNENFAIILSPIINVILWFSCISYPIEIFPEFIQFIIKLNPFYYIFDLFRLVWFLGIDFNKAFGLITPLHIIFTLLFVLITPVIAVYLFNKVYNKYGITGY